MQSGARLDRDSSWETGTKNTDGNSQRPEKLIEWGKKGRWRMKQYPGVTSSIQFWLVVSMASEEEGGIQAILRCLV